MNVVPRSTMTGHKWSNRELTLKCKLKCYVKPMKDPLGVSPSNSRSNPEVVGSIPTEVKRIISLPCVVP